MSRILTLGEELSLICSNARELRGLPGKVTRLTTSVSPFSLRQQLTIPRLLKRHDIDVYHSTYYLMPYRPVVPTVLTVYDLIPALFPSSVGLRARLFFRLTHRLALGASTVVIAISRTTGQALATHYRLPPEKIQVIHLGVAERFKPASTEAIQTVRTKYGLPSDFALYVGINKPHKNLERLVRSWQKAFRDTSRLLIIAGPWDSRYDDVRRLLQRPEVQSNVRLIGPVNDADLPILYSAARLFVFPSLYEGFGLPVLESMACGTPVACSDIPALREVAGNAAVYFDPEDVDSIGLVLSELDADDSSQEKLREAGLCRAATFTWDAAAAATLEVYRKTADAQTRP